MEGVREGSTWLYALGKTRSVSALLLYEAHKDYIFVSESPTLSILYYSSKNRERCDKRIRRWLVWVAVLNSHEQYMPFPAVWLL